MSNLYYPSDFHRDEEDYFEEYPPYNETDGFSEFAEDNYFESIASVNECTGLIPNGMINEYQGRSYSDLYESVHQPKGDKPDKTTGNTKSAGSPEKKI